MEKSNVTELFKRIENESEKFDLIKKECIKACDEYLLDLAKRKENLSEKFAQIAKELESLKVAREKCLLQITEYQATGDGEKAAEAESRVNELDEKIAKKERLQALCDPKVAVGSIKLYEKVTEAYKKIKLAESEIYRANKEISDEIDAEIKKMEEMKAKFKPKNLWEFDHRFEKVFKAQNGREWDRLTDTL